MRKRLFATLMVLILLLGVLPVQVQAENVLNEVRALDNVTGNFSVTDVDSGIFAKFQLDIPDGGAAVLVFYKTTCGNSQNLFNRLNQQDWVHDGRIRIYAVESSSATPEQIQQFRTTYAPELSDVVHWYAGGNNAMMSACWRACGMPSGLVTYPVVALLGRTGDNSYFRWIGDCVTNAADLGDVAQGMCTAAPDLPPEVMPPETPNGMVDLTVAGMAYYDKSNDLVDTINHYLQDNGVSVLNWNARLTELAMEWSAGTPMVSNAGFEPTLPDGTTIKQFMGNALPEIDTFLYWSSSTVDNQHDLLEKIQKYIDVINERGYTQIGVGWYGHEDYPRWTVFITGDLNHMDPVTKSGREFRDYKFSCNPANSQLMPVFEWYYDRFSVFSIGETKLNVVSVKSYHCIYNYEESVLRPYKLSEHIYDPDTGALIATAGAWKDGRITVTGIAPGSGVLEVWAYEGQTEPLSLPIRVANQQCTDPLYNITTEAIGNGTIEVSADNSLSNKLVTVNIQPEHSWTLKKITIKSVGAVRKEIDPAAISLSQQENGSWTFRMPEYSDVHIVAEFELSEYPVTASCTGEGTVESYFPSQEPGKHTSIGIQPAEGWKIGSIEWVGEPAGWSWGEYNSYVFFTMPEHPVELKVSFVEDFVVTDGRISDNLHWYFDGLRLFFIGEGALDIPINGTEGVWARFLDQIEILYIDEGITSICDYAFTNFPHVTTVYIAKSVTSIGREIFQDFPELMEIDVPGSPDCHPDAFLGHEHLLQTHPHEFTEEEIVEPTCTKDGYTRLVCACGLIIEADPVPALGHEYAQGVCIRCGTEDPEYLPTENPFHDVPENAYYREPVLWAVENNITSGTGNGEFSPDMDCTRSQVVTFLWRAAGSPEPSGENPFTDVSKDAWYYKAVLWVVENGITTGTSANTFSPDMACSRSQVVTFLWRAAGSPEPSGENPFSDMSESAWYYKAVLWAVEHNITSGTGGGKFSPDNICTRAQVVTFLFRNMNNG